MNTTHFISHSIVEFKFMKDLILQNEEKEILKNQLLWEFDFLVDSRATLLKTPGSLIYSSSHPIPLGCWCIYLSWFFLPEPSMACNTYGRVSISIEILLISCCKFKIFSSESVRGVNKRKRFVAK